MARTREQALQAVADAFDPIIAILEADEQRLVESLELKRQRLKEKRDAKESRVNYINAFFDAKAIVDNPPGEVADGG